MAFSQHNPNAAIKHILIETLMRAKLITSPDDLDTLLTETIPKIIKATTQKDQFLTEKEVAVRYPFLSVKQLQNWRYWHQGTKYIKTGTSRNSRVLYRVSDIEAWLVQNERNEPYIESP